MLLLFISFLAGVLTVLAPCVFPLLPVIIGGSVADNNKLRPLIITLSLAASVVLFTLLLKFSTSLIGIDPKVWKLLSGGIVFIFGLTYLFPKGWNWFVVKLGVEERAQKNLHGSSQKKGMLGMVLVGASLGPVFASCSPTYAVILATVLPANFLWGLLNLVVYALGLASVMFLVAIFGQKFVRKARWATDPTGWFRKVLGILFLIVGLAIITGYDKKFEAFILDMGWIDATGIEYQLLDKVEE